VNIPGIHHITAIASDPQKNLDFYTRTLGLRLVKLTVNFDDPFTYHFYFGDEAGHPGSILTFFPWPGTPRGRHGTGQATVVSFAVPSIEAWKDRLTNYTIHTRFNNEALACTDPDGMAIELVATGGEGSSISGFHGVTLSESGYESTAKLLTETFGYRLTASEDNRFRYAGSAGNHVDLLCQPDARRGGMGAGTIHHVAFRAETDALQKDWQQKLIGLGYNVTPILDRQYFHSIYFREPGGVLFEIATDPPGFAIDEAPDELGTALKLPPMLEPMRPDIEEAVPKLKLPENNHAR
jgi:glyoxalase family protein